MPDFITCDLSELEEEVLISISDSDLAVLVGRFAGYKLERKDYELWQGWCIIRPDGSSFDPHVTDTWIEAEFCSYLMPFVEETDKALELFAGVEGFELKQIITGAGLPLWKASVPTLPGFGCTEFDIEPARAVAKLYVREKISVPRLKLWLEEKGLL